MRRVAFTLLAAVAALAACGNGAQTGQTAQSVEGVPAAQLGGLPPGCPENGDTFETARIYIEHNATDADTGVHGLFGGTGWRELCIVDPTGRLILHVGPQGQLGDLGLADLFFESREPENDEYPIDRLQADFPEGTYRVSGTDFDGNPLVGTARFSHAIPAEPAIAAPVLGDEESAADFLVDASGLVVRWEPVDETIAGGPVEITAYEVILTKVEHDDPDGWSRPIYDVHVGPTVTELPVPDEFVEPGTLYELEVLAIEESGNQTIGLGFFTTR